MTNRRPLPPVSPKELAALRQSLLVARAAITGDIDQLSREAFDGFERAAGETRDEFEDIHSQEFDLELLKYDEETLQKIDDALERMDNGGYGRCETCGDRIGRERLRAVPHAANCIACQRDLEREAS